MLLALLLNQGTTGSAPLLTFIFVAVALLALLIVALGNLARHGPSPGRFLLLLGVLAFIVLLAAVFF